MRMRMKLRQCVVSVVLWLGIGLGTFHSESHLLTFQNTEYFYLMNVPSMSSILNVGNRSTFTDSSEERDMLNCTEKLVVSMESNCHESPVQLLKRDSRSGKMSGSLLLNWEAFSIPFITITQSRSELFFIAVPFAMDPPYEDKAISRIYLKPNFLWSLSC